jgi:hypothetical protein
MDFKGVSLKLMGPIVLLSFLLIGLWLWQSNNGTQNATQNEPVKEHFENAAPQNPLATAQVTGQPAPVASKEEEAAIQEQFDRDRKQQKQTKDLKIKLEQTNLELEQEKALADINKLKKENVGAFNEPATGGQNNLPEIKVDYIGGDSTKKEAILSINGASYQVKEKSSPTADIQVLSISNSSVTLHFSAPEELTKTIDYKPE